MPVDRPPISAISYAQAGGALSRLIPIAKSDTGQSARVADFLLAWWNGADNGKFEILHLCNVDAPIAEDMLIIMSFLAQNGVIYADAWAERESMVHLWELWRDPRLEEGAEE